MKAVVGPIELQVPSALPRSSGGEIVEISAILNAMMPPTPGGFCAIRLEPVWMSLGDAAGCAAGLDLDEDAPVQQVDVATLQRRIWARGGAIIYVSDVPPSHPDFGFRCRPVVGRTRWVAWN